MFGISNLLRYVIAVVCCNREDTNKQSTGSVVCAGDYALLFVDDGIASHRLVLYVQENTKSVSWDQATCRVVTASQAMSCTKLMGAWMKVLR